MAYNVQFIVSGIFFKVSFRHMPQTIRHRISNGSLLKFLLEEPDWTRVSTWKPRFPASPIPRKLLHSIGTSQGKQKRPEPSCGLATWRISSLAQFHMFSSSQNTYDQDSLSTLFLHILTAEDRLNMLELKRCRSASLGQTPTCPLTQKAAQSSSMCKLKKCQNQQNSPSNKKEGGIYAPY